MDFERTMRPRAGWRWLMATALAGLSALTTAGPLPTGLSRAATPDWVEASPTDLQPPAPGTGTKNGQHLLLVDRQTRFDGQQLVDYRKLAIRALNTQGVEQSANVQIDFDPSYQRLTLHSLQLRRGSEVIDQFDGAHIRLLQREQNLESLVIDGSKTAHIVLKDVRVGDVVEYSFSRSGSNPALLKQLSGGFELQWSVPVEQLKARLLWPRELPLYWRQHAGAPSPQRRAHTGHDEYRWDLRQVPALPPDSDTPGWHEGYPWAQWSSAQSWQQVAAWAAPLYQPPARLPPSLQKEVDRIAATHSSPEQRLLAAMRFVQSEVRYLAVALGSGSYVPTPPAQVLQRRFGDCKDKTLLTLSLLKGLGIEARAALVNTELRRGIAQRLPSPTAFDHVLVEARLNGQSHWLDPTRAPQSGQSLAQWVRSDFERALVVDPGTQDLQTMGPRQTSGRKVHLLIDGSSGFDEPAHLTVTTTAEGQAAESLRAALANNSRELLQKEYLNFYASSYPGLEVAAAMEVRDEPEHNRIQTVEHYVTRSLWTREEGSHRLEAAILAPDLNELLQAPKSQVRTAPLALRHPVELNSEVEVRLPESWPARDKPLTIKDPAFELQHQEHWQGQTVRLTDHFRSQADHVPAADIGRYASNLERARQGVQLMLYRNDPAAAPAADAPHWLPAAIGSLTVLLTLWGAWRLYRWDPAPAGAQSWEEAQAPRGLGGWLILPTIGLPVKLFWLGKALVESLPSFRTATWVELTQAGGAAYHPLWLPYLLVCLVGLICLMALSLLVLVLLLKRRSSVPRLYLLLLGLSLFMLVLDRVSFATIPGLEGQETTKEVAEAYRSMFFCLVWSAYFLRSKRVKATFVERHQRGGAAPAGLQPAGG